MQCNNSRTMKFLITFIYLVPLLSIYHVNAKVYTRCGLVEELQRQRIPRSFIGMWVCLIESESGKDTSKVTNKASGSKALGLYQISSKEWCTYQRPGGKCNMKCEDLINEDVRDDTLCANRVYQQDGFKAWDGWVRNCYKRPITMPKC